MFRFDRDYYPGSDDDYEEDGNSSEEIEEKGNGDDLANFFMNARIDLHRRAEVRKIGARTISIAIHVRSFRGRLVPLFNKIERQLLRVRKESDRGNCVMMLDLEPDGERFKLRTDDWAALEGVIRTCDHLHEINLSMDDQLRSKIPSSFILTLRQYCFDVTLAIPQENDPDEIISTLTQQQQTDQVHSPPISPFAFGTLCFDYLSFDNFTGLISLGRSGPEGVNFSNPEGFLDRNGLQESCESFKALLARSYWIEFKEGYATRWLSVKGITGFHKKLNTEERKVESELAGSVKRHNRRNADLRKETRKAAFALLQVVRTLMLSQTQTDSNHCDSDTQTISTEPVPIQQTAPSPHSPRTSTFVLNPSAPAFVPSSSACSASCFTSPSSCDIAPSDFIPTSPPLPESVFPVLSLPYDILDQVLSCLSPGRLSSRQHRSVVNWASDRSTLGAKKVCLLQDFLRETDCWKWESEKERVNLGLDYE